MTEKQLRQFRHGTYNGYKYHKCRCDACIKVFREYSRKYVRARRQRLQNSESIPHGTSNGYNNYRCRCDACVIAGLEYGQRRRQRLQNSKSIPHGTYSGYKNYKCKCGICMEIGRKYNRENWSREKVKKYGITHEEYKYIYKKQNGLCAIEGCGRPIHGRDHNHLTGMFRGLLCRGCNSALGHTGDDIVRLTGLIDYLQEHDGFVSITGARLKRARELQARGVNKDTATI